MIGQNFPVSKAYQGRILDAVTINRSANWWTAALAIKKPNTDAVFLAIYKWRLTDTGWKQHQKLYLNSVADSSALQRALQELAAKFKTS